ncbi:hypothetical protein ACFY0R_39710 [Streptomyces sp. NPDC001633]|uniref:hypothetical protein n=1 Tax=Streptomyces sp. NPDC001633 TaxID=3364595 RepID=UPI0036A3417D
MDRIGNPSPEITGTTPADRPEAGTAPTTDPDPIASAAEAAEANFDYAPDADYLGRQRGGGRDA